MVTFSVANDDVLLRPGGLLVLKYAQAFYGVDWAVADRLGLLETPMPEDGDELLIANARGIEARDVLFLGVCSLRHFSYAKIREFGARAARSALSMRPGHSEIVLTLHGTGYGLDEIEAFKAELAGVLEGIESGNDAPGSATRRDWMRSNRSGRVDSPDRRFVFVERDRDRAERMRHLLHDIVGDQAHQRNRDDRALGEMRYRLGNVGTDASRPDHVFVAMPFDHKFDDRFHYGIMKPVHGAGLVCERMDQLSFTGDVVDEMKRRIATASLVVADISTQNPNVYLEIGFAWAAGVPTILVREEGTTLLFDIQGQRCLEYRSIKDLEDKLREEIGKLVF